MAEQPTTGQYIVLRPSKALIRTTHDAVIDLYDALVTALENAREVIHLTYCGDNAPEAWKGECSKECSDYSTTAINLANKG